MTIRMVIGDRHWGDGTDCLNCGGGTKGTTN